jgi:choice-of-anchor C domain-containing protein
MIMKPRFELCAQPPRCIHRCRIALASAALGLASIGAGAQIIQNGSFELGVNPGSFTNLPGGSTAITGWTVIGSSIDYVGSVWTSSNGTRSLDLDGSDGPPYTNGGVAQSFATIAGTSYVVSFDMAGNPNNAPTIKPMQVSAAGQSAVFTFDITGKSLSNMGWVAHTWTFIATNSTTTLTFQSLTTSPNVGWGPALDNVSVTAVPEPGAAILLALGGITVLLRKHFKLQPQSAASLA